jgi:transcriptional regulator of arginine metabolism
MTAVSPTTKAARQAQIATILAHTQVRSQEELAGILADRGVHVTQATLSRDLEEMGAVRLRGAAGSLVYALPGDPGGPGSRPGGVGAGTEPQAGSPAPAETVSPARPDGLDRAGYGTLPRVTAELLVSAEASANLVVLRTPAGGAQFLASALDHAEWPAILGTVAGDDTVLVIARDPAGGGDLAQALLRQAERRPQTGT